MPQVGLVVCQAAAVRLPLGMPRQKRLTALTRHLRPCGRPAGAPAAGHLSAAASSVSGLRVTALSPIFGVRVDGVDTASPLCSSVAAELRALMSRHKLLLLSGRRINVAQLSAFGTALGLGAPETFGAEQLAEYMSACKEDSRVKKVEYGPDVPPADINIWHQDHTWQAVPTRYELSYIDETPEVGGSVIYADTAAAFQSLSPRMQQVFAAVSLSAHPSSRPSPCPLKRCARMWRHSFSKAAPASQI